jgi:hypothetical protein
MVAWRIACLTLIFPVQTAIAETVSRAYIGDEDGRARLIFANGAMKVMPPERQQVGSDNISVGSDKHTVA